MAKAKSIQKMGGVYTVTKATDFGDKSSWKLRKQCSMQILAN